MNLPLESYTYLTRRTESNVYLDSAGLNVIKLKNPILTPFGQSTSRAWLSIICFDPSYSLLGFLENEGESNAVLRQPFVDGEQAAFKDIGDQ